LRSLGLTLSIAPAQRCSFSVSEIALRIVCAIVDTVASISLLIPRDPLSASQLSLDIFVISARSSFNSTFPPDDGKRAGHREREGNR
jgi:hypothetical protein